MLSYKFTILLLIISMLTSVLACGGGGSSSPTPNLNTESTAATAGNLESAQAQQITAIGQCNTEEDRKPAIEDVVRQGFTLGLVDENGNQLNPNVPTDALSLTPEDVAAHAVMVPGGNYRTISYVVDTLAEAGVVLASTDEVITLEDFLPDLQDYVDQSFANPDDPVSSLGLLIGSGYELEVPASAPTIDGDTMISPLASLMMTADILLGTEEKLPPQNGDDVISKIISVFVEDAYADDNQNLVSKVKGHITTIKDIFSKEEAKNIVVSMELSNRYVVRVAPLGSFSIYKKYGTWEFLRWLTLTEAATSSSLDTFIFEMQAGLNNKTKLVREVPTLFTLKLISSVDIVVDDKKLWTTLFADAGAEFVPYDTSTIDQNGHRVYDTVGEISYASLISEVDATEFPKEESRTALLLATAEIDVDQIMNVEEISALGKGYGIDLRNTLSSIKPTPWVCAVVLEKSENLVCDKEYFTNSDVLWWEGCTLNGQKHGQWIHYYENGNKVSQVTYNNGKKDGFHTTYYSNPAGKVDCEAEYEDDELIWGKCYSTEGQVLSETTRDGVAKNYYWSGRISKECRGTITEEIECQRFCDNEAHTLCDEFMLDDYGYPINEGDGCDTKCK
ncbi:MAG: hypothetical protein GY845_12455 [Planctomycetes bacterium]|nr:hypothetical protein [Planctomycetota bacterium]